MRTLYTRSLAASGKFTLAGLVGFAVMSAGCTKRANDCTWNANCETASGGSSGSGGVGDGGSGGDAGNSAKGGTTSGGKSSATTTPTCSGSPEDPLCITTEHGVFVSPLGDDTAGDGGPEKPYATLSRALSVAVSDNRKRSVYACATAGNYALTETLVIGAEFDGINLYGGFDCSNPKAWIYPKTGDRSNFGSSATLAVKLEGITESGTGIQLHRLRFEAASAANPGESSIALLAVNSPNVTLTDLELVAGNGADGADAAAIEGAATGGTDGVKGTDACSLLPINATSVAGAAFVTTTCDGVIESQSGKGGAGGVGTDAASAGGDGTPLPVPNDDLWGLGGVGQGGTQLTCQDGKKGSPGTAGAPAQKADSPGTLTSIGFVTANGKDGLPGRPGQGGGGGGGSKAATAQCGNGAYTGASGASGGSGGCGGKPGKGGQGGGASIALALVNSKLTYVNCALKASSGGKGGKGSAGQGGGGGGSGGKAGTALGSGSISCVGGNGGAGGPGSAGGGGVGGPSIAVAYAAGAPVEEGLNNTKTVASAAATGGTDGNGSAGAAGGMGLTIEVKDLATDSTASQ